MEKKVDEGSVAELESLEGEEITYSGDQILNVDINTKLHFVRDYLDSLWDL